jgi:hypothetical protein
VIKYLVLYGRAHVLNLGVIIKPTNIQKILLLDLLKTDYFHGPAYPTFLYYNPYSTPKTVDLNLGPERKDVYDAVTGRFLTQNARTDAQMTIPPDTARVVVWAPPGGKLTHEGTKTLIDGVVVDYKR